MSLPTLLQTNTLTHFDKSINVNDKRAIDIILDHLSQTEERILILQSGTGSAKSTALGPEIYLKFKKNVVITQPRVLTAIEIPKTIASIKSYTNRGIELYKNLGYQTKEFTKRVNRGVLFITTGILLQQLKTMSDKDIKNRYSYIIIDEVHDRTLDIEITLFLLRELKNRLKKDCPFIILMSATINTQEYADYFNTKCVFKVEGKSHEVVENFLENDTFNFTQKTGEIVKSLNKDQSPNSDILIFASGLSQILKIEKELQKINEKEKYKFLIVKITSGKFKSADDDYQNLFDDKIKRKKIIIATNIAETGVTINSLKYCIDLGYVTSLEYNPTLDSTLICNKNVSQSMSIQRKGRVGRTQKGYWYPLYTKKTFDKLKPSLPDIYLNDFMKFYLVLASKNQLDSKLMSIPLNETINIAKFKLTALHFCDENNEITELGKLALQFKLVPLEACKILLTSFIYNNINYLDIVTIVSYITLSKNSLVEHDFKCWNINILDNDRLVNLVKLRLFVSCDFIEFLIVFKEFENILENNSIKNIKKWCSDNKIKFNGMTSLIQIRDDIIKELLFKCGLNPFQNNHIDFLQLLTLDSNKVKKEFTETMDYIKSIKKCLYEGYKFNIATLDDKNNYVSKSGIIQTTNITKNLPDIDKKMHIQQIKPKIILYDNLFMVFNNVSNRYELSASNCSVLDVLDIHL